MVYLEYPAIFTDSIGCDKCFMFLSKNNWKLKVRGFNFYSEDYGFDFYTNNESEAKKFFYLKDNELIDYILDVRVNIPMIYEQKAYKQKAILRIERKKNYYSNKIIFKSNKKSYSATGLNLKNLLFNLKNNLPDGFNLKMNMGYIIK